MPSSVFLSSAIELGLISLTFLLLAQPHFFFRFESKRLQSATWICGGFFLCITFCWSVVWGIVLYMNEIVVRF